MVSCKKEVVVTMWDKSSRIVWGCVANKIISYVDQGMTVSIGRNIAVSIRDQILQDMFAAEDR
jgi:hypothetical protein